MPALLSTPLPPVDPLEPNDDIDQVKPGEMFAGGKTPINPSGRNTSLRARIDASEDPDDVYRVVAPARRKVTVTVGGSDLALRLWGPLAKTVWTGSYGRIGASDRTTRTETLAWNNKSNRAVVLYAHVQLSGRAESGSAQYTLGVRITK
jgi:hypothetical protein